MFQKGLKLRKKYAMYTLDVLFSFSFLGNLLLMLQHLENIKRYVVPGFSAWYFVKLTGHGGL